MQLENLERLYDPQFQTKSDYNIKTSSMSNIVTLWFEQAKNNRLLSRYLHILPNESIELAHIQLQVLQGATDNVLPMVQFLKQTDIVQRGIQ